MTDLSMPRSRGTTSASLAELHRLCDEDYAKGQAQRATVVACQLPSYTSSVTAAAIPAPPEPTDLDVAISLAQQLLDCDQILSVREALRLLLRALGAEPQPRCPAAHPDDPTPCGGPVVVTVLDPENAGADGCEHHAARLLASLRGGSVYGLPHAPAGTAVRVFKAANQVRRGETR